MKFEFNVLGGIIVLLFSAAGRRGEDREEVKSGDELIEFKFRLRGGGLNENEI